MIENFAMVAAVGLLVVVAALATARIVIAEREAGSGTPELVVRSARVRSLDRVLMMGYALLAVALLAFFIDGLL